MKKTILASLLSLFSLAHAENTTTALQSKATLSATCAFTINTLSFGTYDPMNPAPQQASSNINVICSKGLSYTLGVDRYSQGDPFFTASNSPISFGNNAPALLNNSSRVADGSVIVPGTENASKALLYNLYIDSGRTKVWTGMINHWVGSNQFITGVGTGSSQNIPFYGSIDSGQFVLPGSYSANMTTTIMF